MPDTLQAQAQEDRIDHVPDMRVTASITLPACDAEPEVAPVDDLRGRGNPHEFGGVLILQSDPAVRYMVAQELDASGRIKIGDAATCTMDAYPELSIPCRVIEITPIAREPQFRSLRRNFRVMIELGENYPDRMRPGMSVKVEVEAFRLPDSLLAPRGALNLEVEPPVAFLRGGGDREVRLGACNALECIVEDGLSEDDRLRYAP